MQFNINSKSRFKQDGFLKHAAHSESCYYWKSVQVVPGPLHKILPNQHSEPKANFYRLAIAVDMVDYSIKS